ncbi:MAG: hypothetical protein PHO83_10405 [Geobacteraceae bacterium]|nr:hypothetical protein [Geobacteraceae bacterium]
MHNTIFADSASFVSLSSFPWIFADAVSALFPGNRLPGLPLAKEFFLRAGWCGGVVATMFWRFVLLIPGLKKLIGREYVFLPYVM